MLVKDVQKAPNGQHLQRAIIEEGEIKTNQEILASVNSQKRNQTIKNHSATHLLHQALKDVLSSHVNQAGSLVEPNRLRFDFSHFGQITSEELVKIEEIVNEKIWASIPVIIQSKPIAEAKRWEQWLYLEKNMAILFV